MARTTLQVPSENGSVPAGHIAPSATPIHRIMVVLGTRPEAIKLAPLIVALRESPRFSVTTVITGQHREMLDPILTLFDIVPDADLDIMAVGQSLTDISIRTLERLSPIVETEAPDALIVQGDTTAAFFGALAAFYHQVPVVHLEAGLRSGDMYSPFPEELNRKLISQVTKVHLAATEGARQNLLVEGTDPNAVVVVGNTVIDSLVWAIDQRAPYNDPALEALESDPRKVLLVTAHRRESWGEQMESVGHALADLAKAEPELVIVLPLHRNPIVRDAVLPAVAGHSNVWVREPLGYGSFARLMARADILLTDSGGIQEEGPTLGKPVLVMRDTTERPEAVDAGSVRLVGTDRHTIVSEVRNLLHDEDAYRMMAVPRPVYGDGLAAGRCVDSLAHFFGFGDRPEEFSGLAPMAPLALVAS